MVNVEKHKRIQAKFGMLPFEDKGFMNKYVERVINDTNENPQRTIDGLDELNNELNHYYDNLASSNVGSVIKIGNCQRILEIYEHTFVIKTTIQYNYHVLKIDGEIIKSILRKCDRILNEFRNIQALQNKNIDRKGYGGIYSAKLLDSDAKEYSLETFENIVRLKDSLNLVGVDGSI